MDEIPEDSIGFDRWYESIGHESTGGTDISLDDVLRRREAITELALTHGVFNVRLVGAILEQPIGPPDHVEFVVERDRDWPHSGFAYFAFATEVVKLLRHYVTVHTGPAAEVFFAEAHVTL